MIHFRPGVLLRGSVFLVACSALVAAQDRAGSVSEFRLSNGMQFLVVQRPHVPAVSIHLRVRAGTADEPTGLSGVALMVQRMFGQGSETWGSKKPSEEKSALAEADGLLALLREEDSKGEKASEVIKGQHEAKARYALGKADTLSAERGYFENLLKRNVASQAGSAVGADYSDYWLTLDSHRAEVWFKMCSEFLARPSARHFYAERNELIDQQAGVFKSGVFQRDSAVFAAAFLDHPYKRMIAPKTDINQVLAQDALAFHRSYYVPSHLVVAIVGDMTPAEARRLAEAHFGKLSGAPPQAAKKVAFPPPPREDQRFRVAVSEAPVIIHYWYRPEAGDPDDPALDILQAVFAGGRDSRMHRELVEEQAMALTVRSVSRYPGGRYPALFTLEAIPSPNRVIEDVDAAMLDFVDRLAKAPVTQQELASAKQFWRRTLVSDAVSGPGRAAQLVRLQTEHGSYRWEDRMAKLEAVTLEDVQRVAGKYLAGQPRFVVQQLVGLERIGEQEQPQ
jgi:predicted Zn-dependent peptidase